MATDVDLLIVGAGLSGIGAAAHLAREAPGLSYALLEMRGRLGGTWDLFRYPGVRSDSDMFTLGYDFKPWTGTAKLASGADILAYLEETAREYDVERHIRYRHKLIRADWDSANARWTAQIDVLGPPDTPSERVTMTANFLYFCTGYYDYDTPYRPRIPGQEEFAGQWVHPQFWPEGLEYAGRRVVVIGSGATAVTLVPALATQAAHVTMLQRTPSYVLPMPSADPIAALATRLPPRSAYLVNRWAHLLQAWGIYRLSRVRPDWVRALIRAEGAKHLADPQALAEHFTPPYDPWDQRLCLAPDGDLYTAIDQGRVEVVTDTIARVVPDGIVTARGRTLPADIIVAATGLTILPGGGAELWVDGVPVDLPRTVTYKGVMLSGVPNFALALGYTNASWTLKVDLTSRYLCRLLTYLRRHGFDSVTPVPPPGLRADRPIMDFAAGYVRRAAAIVPRQGERAPWDVPQNYLVDRFRLRRRGRLDDGVVFARARSSVPRRSRMPRPGTADERTVCAGGRPVA